MIINTNISPLNGPLPSSLQLLPHSESTSRVFVTNIKPWSNGLASSRKLKTWVYLRLRLARPCVHLRSLWSRSNFNASFLPFGHPTQVSSQVQLAATCDYLRVRLTRALDFICIEIKLITITKIPHFDVL